MIYDGADKAIREMNRANLKAFNHLKLAKWDEISIIRSVGKAYDDSVRLAKRKYYEIGIEAFIVALYQAMVSPVQATEMAEKIITADWVLEMLEEADPVTLYIFTEETERKKQRLVEALSVAQNRNAEIDKALRYWTMQIGQYAISVVDKARIDAFKAAGIKKGMWNTEKDGNVCEKCKALDGKVFPIDKIPPKQHWGDRCWITPVID